MVFSQPTFLFVFLPLFLLAYAVGGRARNAVLLTTSLFFYAWGEPRHLPLLLGVIAFNWALCLAMDRTGGRARLLLLLAAVAGDIGVLAVFKYAGFAAENLSALRVAAGGEPIVLDPPALPLGISFFVFQSITYVVDVHRRNAPVQRNPLKVALYVSMFPQLVAGPIVRFREIAEQLEQRSVDLRRFASGVERFLQGLAKKVVLADGFARVVDPLFAADPAGLGPAVAWLGILCFGLQLYFDFSGYSDMAIGLGRMLGFRLPENFDHPYESRSLREFWRRWHLTLTRFFRDYVHAPLVGGSASRLRRDAALLFVFLLTGLWHGASWNFAVFGASHGALMVLERRGLSRVLERLPRAVGHVYLWLVLGFSFVLFRASDLGHALAYTAAAVGLGEASAAHALERYLTPQVGVMLAVAIPLCTAWPRRHGLAWLRALAARPRSPALRRGWGWARAGAFAVLALLTLSGVASQSYRAFFYFRF